MSKACSTNSGEDECIEINVTKPEGKRPLGRPRRRWVNNSTRVQLGVLEWSGINCIDLTQERDK
jgi:hypothetical protein